MINDNLAHQVRAIWCSMFGHLPKNATISDVALNITDGVHNTVVDDPEGDCLLLSCKNIKGGQLSINNNERRINRTTYEKLHRRTKLAKGDILLSSVGTVGEILLLNTDPDGIEFQRSVAMIKPNTRIVSPLYLYEALMNQQADIVHAAHGAVQQCLFISDISGFSVACPNHEQISAFDDLAMPLFDMISHNEAENQRLITLRDSLLPRLISGEIDVSDILI